MFESAKCSIPYQSLTPSFCLIGLFWSAHQRFFRSLCIASKVGTAISLAKKALDDGHCCVIGLQSTGEARSRGAAAAAGINEDDGGSFDDFVSAPNEGRYCFFCVRSFYFVIKPKLFFLSVLPRSEANHHDVVSSSTKAAICHRSGISQCEQE